MRYPTWKEHFLESQWAGACDENGIARYDAPVSSLEAQSQVMRTVDEKSEPMKRSQQ